MTIRRFFRLPKAGLATQFLGLLVLAILVAQAISFWIFFDERRVSLRDMARENIVRRAASMVRLLEDTPEIYHQRILNASRSQIAFFSIDETPALKRETSSAIGLDLQRSLEEDLGFDRPIRVKLRTGKDMPPPPELMMRFKRNGDEEAFRKAHERAAKLARRLGDLTMAIELSDGRWFNTRTIFRPPNRTLIPLLTQMAITMLVVLGLVAILVRRISKPIQDLSLAAGKLGRGEELDPIVERGPREVKELTRAFNDMQTRLTRFVSDRTRMLAAISHDLRTPITSLRLRAEFIDDDENREKIIATLDEMAQMTEATLAFAREEAQSEATVQADLTSILRSVVDDQSDMGRKVTFADDAAKQVVAVRPVSIKRALVNLIENGVRYGGEVSVSIEALKEDVAIHVRDKGPGVPEERLKDIFEPFVRLEESRSEETGGIGLGLSITRSIVHAHGGTITLKNHPEGGLQATIHLPRQGH